jgi:hypothetical protein
MTQHRHRHRIHISNPAPPAHPSPRAFAPRIKYCDARGPAPSQLHFHGGRLLGTRTRRARETHRITHDDGGPATPDEMLRQKRSAFSIG